MDIKTILAKIAKGENLTDAEKEFVGKFDLQAQLDTAAAGARKKADGEAKTAKDALAALQAEFDAFKAEHDPAKGQSEITKLTERIGKLEKAKADAEAKATALERTGKIRALAKEAGIVAAKGVDAASLDLLVDALMAKVDLDDADAVKAAFDGFKTANAGLISAETVGGAGAKGQPGAGNTFTGKNPFAKETFNLTKQCELIQTNPQQAKQLAAEAGVSLEDQTNQ